MVHGRVLTVERGRGGGEEGTDDDMECVGVEDGRSSSAVSESRPSGRCACLPGDTLAGGLGFLADGRRTSTVDGSTGLEADANGAKSMVARRWTRMLRVFCLAGVAAQSDGPFAVGTVEDASGRSGCCQVSGYSVEDDGDGVEMRACSPVFGILLGKPQLASVDDDDDDGDHASVNEAPR